MQKDVECIHVRAKLSAYKHKSHEKTLQTLERLRHALSVFVANS